SINLTTIYRTLHTLEDQGLIRQQYTSPDHDRKCYTLIPETYHFTCQQCGKVIAFGSDKVANLIHGLEADLDLKVLTTCMCVTGICPSCWAEAQLKKEDEPMQSTMTLDQLTPGQIARVTKVGGAGAIRRRLMDMGVVRGVEIELVKAAPLGDPLEYLLRGYHLSLRKSEAQFIEVDL
ncbi:MAG: FeoA domain-containing protein, partial [Anaerolineae bacterium]|nr:FeoA domain-containing protein [Anaerolineae bacterium]